MSVDKRTIAVYDAKATDYATRFDSGDKPGKHLAQFMRALPKGGHVLDLGCGPGGSAGHMARAGFDVLAMDASAAMVKLAAENHGIATRQATFDDLKDVAAFDGVWANFSLLHAPRDAIPHHLGAVATALRENGVFHIALKTGTGAHRDGMDRLYTFLEEDELAELLHAAGFTIQTTDRGKEAGLAGTVDPWIAHLCVKS